MLLELGIHSEWHSFTSSVVILSNCFFKSNVSVSVERSFCHYGNFDHLHQHTLNVFIEKFEDFWKNNSKTYDYKKSHNLKGKTNKALSNPNFYQTSNLLQNLDIEASTRCLNTVNQRKLIFVLLHLPFSK